MFTTKSVEIKGSVVAITGGARGIGLAIAKALIAEGARVSIGDIDADLVNTTAAETGAYGCHLDVRERASFADFIQSTEIALGAVDIMINNAGIMPMGSFLNVDPDLSDTQIDINLRGVIHGMQLTLPGMLTRERGHIINIASLAGLFAIPGAAVYSATKYAVVGLTETVAAEYRDSAVNFTTIMPTIVSTELSSGSTDAGAGIPNITPEIVAANVVNSIKRPKLHVTIPEYMEAAHSIYNLLPRWATERGRRLFGDDRILKKWDNKAHAGYSQRIASLTDDK
ncbi:3-hydroxybutyrate dehydrogenase [Gammaproteobacteria bacterium 45_16_T64]|mgnify:FL=1|nr:3-hydroxybutyrate dehydrogenase [Gammaproteobacteria bacterium 45_16_T64]